MMNEKALLDVDGVLADFKTGSLIVHEVTKDPYDDPANRGVYAIEKLLGLTRTQYYKPMDYKFWVNLPLLPQAHRIVAAIEEVFGEDNVCLLTSPISTNTGECVAGKIDWIKKHFPEYLKRRKFLIGPAKEFCAGPWHYLFDDYEGNIEKFNKADGFGLLMPQAWNSLHMRDPLTTLNDYLDAIKKVHAEVK